MKSMFFALLVLINLAVPAQAAVFKAVDCVGPVGAELASMTGSLRLTKLNTGAYEARGQLTIQGNGRSTTLSVLGQYDKLNGAEYATVGDAYDQGMVSLFYINFGDNEDQALSYVEDRNGKMHPLNCGSRN